MVIERVEHGAVADRLRDDLRSAAAEAEGAAAVVGERVGVLIGVGVADFDLVLGDQGVDERADRVAVADLAERGAGPVDDFVVFVA